jgi:hypothetical protein
MTTAVSSLIAKAKILTQDPTGVRWTDPEWILWASDGQREVIRILRLTKNADVLLDPGAIQSLPADGVEIVDIPYYMSDPDVIGLPIREVSRRVMDAAKPTWMYDTGTVSSWMRDETIPLRFYVHPPPPDDQALVRMHYIWIPPLLTADTDLLAIPDDKAPAVVDYMLYRAYSKDVDVPGSAELAALAYAQFMRGLGQKPPAQRRG